MKLESLKMNLKSLKSRVNNEKGCSFKGKSTKIVPAFIQNKPNFIYAIINISSCVTSKYEILPAWRSKKQTQFKPNTNPIFYNAIIGLSSFITGKYVKFENSAGEKTNPNKPNFKPNF